jgi:hypothetical protein
MRRQIIRVRGNHPVSSATADHSVYVLPAGEQALEDFQWLLREIEQGGGEGIVWEGKPADGLNDQDVRALFDATRDADYAEIAKELRDLSTALKRGGDMPAEQIDVVNDVGNGAQSGILEADAVEKHLERTHVAFMGDLGLEHVEAELAPLCRVVYQ